MKYYLVKAKCGHVGIGKYISKTFPVVASSKVEAASKIKRYRKVKKHLKDLIESVEEVTCEEYLKQKDLNKDDLYLHSHTKQEIIMIINSDCVSTIKPSKKYYKKDFEFNCRKERIDYFLKKALIKGERSYDYVY